MKLQDVIEALSLEVITPGADLQRDVTTGYVSDLLSDVIANTGEGCVWVTYQVHLNIVAVASLKGHAAIILVSGRTPNADTLAKAVSENVPILTTPLSAFDSVGRLYGLGLRCR